VAELLPLHPASRRHLEALSDATGIMQHAAGSRADAAHGYCTDDVARALRVDLLHAEELGWAAVAASARRHLSFLAEAFIPTAGRFRNFRAVDRSWLDDGGSQDCQGRAIQALGETILLAPDAGLVATASLLLGRALPAVEELTALRARSAALLGCAAAVRGGMRGEVESTLRRLAGHLGADFWACPDPTWPWPEPVLTYENGLPVQALIVAGVDLGSEELLDAGLRTLDWLIAAQTAPAGHLSPVGNRWWPRDGVRSRFDQQPIEATAFLLAAREAFTATGRVHYGRAVEQAYGWFLGANDHGISVAAAHLGACHDGLTRGGVNANQGAESTLVWLIALEQVRRLRANHPVGGHPAGRRPRVAVPVA
jgi:hypothetical protein